MRHVRRALFFLVVLAALIATNFGREQAEAQTLSNPQVQLVYLPAHSAGLKGVADRVKKFQELEQFGQFLVALRLPKKLVIQFDECGASTRPYRAGGPVTVCYDLVDRIERVAANVAPETRNLVLAGTTIQAIFHETAPAVYDLLHVPIWGRLDDAEDRLAGFLMVEFGSDLATELIIGTATFFKESGKTWTGSDFADAQSPEAQRFYNYLCMAYGREPKTFASLRDSRNIGDLALPEDRASKCAREFEQVRRSFNLRIMPYVDPELLVKLRAHPWTQLVGTKP